MLSEFKAFLLKTNALALAVGVIIGAASGKVVSALVADILMPPIGLILPKGDWRDAQYELSRSVVGGKVTINAIKYGDFLGNIIDFIAIALVVFFVTKWLLKPAPEAPVQTAPTARRLMRSTPLGASPAPPNSSPLSPPRMKERGPHRTDVVNETIPIRLSHQLLCLSWNASTTLDTIFCPDSLQKTFCFGKLTSSTPIQNTQFTTDTFTSCVFKSERFSSWTVTTVL